MAVCERTGQVGAVISSSSICVASRCVTVVPGVGAALSQNVTDPTLGPALLDGLARGLNTERALADVIHTRDDIEWRQIGLIDSTGQGACYSGREALGVSAVAYGESCAAMGNLLHNSRVPGVMVQEFERTQDEALPDRLLAALEKGLAEGGEEGPIHSAGMIVARELAWPIVDLRVDWDETPDVAITNLRQIWSVYAPQMEAYVKRATDPRNAESFGVPGNR